MSTWPTGVVGIIYLAIAIDLLRKGQVGLGITYAGYVIGNVGLIMEMTK